jgi:hypothetical protein
VQVGNTGSPSVTAAVKAGVREPDIHAGGQPWIPGWRIGDAGRELPQRPRRRMELWVGLVGVGEDCTTGGGTVSTTGSIPRSHARSSTPRMEERTSGVTGRQARSRIC